jgi:hypothetical protein
MCQTAEDDATGDCPAGQAECSDFGVQEKGSGFRQMCLAMPRPLDEPATARCLRISSSISETGGPVSESRVGGVGRKASSERT